MFDLTFIDKYGTTVTNLTQWDMNQKIYIESSSFDNKAPQFHFCNKNSEKALVVQSKIEGDLLEITVPNALLIEPYPITVYAYLMDIDNSVESGKTIEYTTIPVRQRPEPSDFTYEENTDIVDVQDIVAEIVAYNQQIKLEEKARVEAESLRVEAENQRKSNEEQRQLNAEEVIQNAETATVRANEAAEVCEDLIENLGGNAEIVHSSEKGVANGVATLDENGKLPMTQIPDDLNFELPEEIDATTLDGYSADDFESKTRNDFNGFIPHPKSGQFISTDTNSKYGFLEIAMPIINKGDGNYFSFRLDINNPYGYTGSQQQQEIYLISGSYSLNNGWRDAKAQNILQNNNVDNKVYFYRTYDSSAGGYVCKIYIGDSDNPNATWQYSSVSIVNLTYGTDFYNDLGSDVLYNSWNNGFQLSFTSGSITASSIANASTYIITPHSIPKSEQNGYIAFPTGATYTAPGYEVRGLIAISLPPDLKSTGVMSFDINVDYKTTQETGYIGSVKYKVVASTKRQYGYIQDWDSSVSAIAIPLKTSDGFYDGTKGDDTTVISHILPIHFTKLNNRLTIILGDTDKLTELQDWSPSCIIRVSNLICGSPNELSKGWTMQLTQDSSVLDYITHSFKDASIVSSSNTDSNSSQEYVFNLDSTDQYLKVKLPCSIPKLYNYYDSDYNTRSLENYLKCHYSFKIKLEDKYGGNWAEYLVHCTLNDYDCIEYQSASVLGCGSNLYSGYSYHDYSNFTFDLWYKEIVDNIDSVKSYLSKFIDIYGVESSGSSSELIPYIFIQTGINDFTRITIKDINYYFDYDEEPNISLKVPFPNLLEDIISNGEWEVSAASEVDYGEYTSITTIENPSIHSARMIDGQNAQDYINSAVGILGLYTSLYSGEGWKTLVQSKASRDNGFECHISADSGSDILDIVFNYCPQGYTSRPENFKLNVVYSNQLESKHLIDKIRIVYDTDSTMYLQVHRTSANMDNNYINARMRNTRNWEYANAAPSESATIIAECDVAAQVSTLTSANSTPVSVSATAPDTNYLWVDITDMSAIKLKVYNSETSAWIAIN